MKCKALAKFLNSSIMIFIYSTYFAARIDFTLGKPLLLWQIFHLRGFPLPFPSSIPHSKLPMSCPVWASSPRHWAALWQWGWARPKPPWCPTPRFLEATWLPHAVLRLSTHPLISPPHCCTKGKPWAHDRGSHCSSSLQKTIAGTNNPSHLVTASFINSN